MTAALVICAVLAFLIAQGGAVVATAWLVSTLTGWGSGSGKSSLIVQSWIAWVCFTVLGYFALGGDGGLMDGFGFLIFLCFTSLVSTIVWAWIWASKSNKGARSNG